MAFGLKTYPDKAPSWKTWRNGLNSVIQQSTMTASECDETYGTNFAPKPKDHPLYKMLKARKEDNMT